MVERAPVLSKKKVDRFYDFETKKDLNVVAIPTSRGVVCE